MKTLQEYTDKDLIALLNIHDILAKERVGQICAEILIRMNNNKDLLPEKKWEHKGPLC